MSQDNQEKPAVKTTIVGGRPPGSGKDGDAVPRGIEILLKKASVDESFRKMFLGDRLNAAKAIGLTLNSVEVAMLKAIPETTLDRMIAATKVQPRIKQAFMGYAAAVMLAALTAASDGRPQDMAQASYGIQPGTLQGGIPGGATGGIRAEAIGSPAWENSMFAKYNAESYLKIASQDENAPRGKLEIIIENWETINVLPRFYKIHLTKIESSAPLEKSRTEGLGYAFRGQLLKETVPVGNYLVEIALPGKSFSGTKTISVKEKETATLSFKVKVANPNDDLPPGQITTPSGGKTYYFE